MAEELRYHKTLRVEIPALLLKQFKEALPYRGMMSEVIRAMIRAYCKAVQTTEPSPTDFVQEAVESVIKGKGERHE